jgi:hypothetical protein
MEEPGGALLRMRAQPGHAEVMPHLLPAHAWGGGASSSRKVFPRFQLGLFILFVHQGVDVSFIEGRSVAQFHGQMGIMLFFVHARNFVSAANHCAAVVCSYANLVSARTVPLPCDNQIKALLFRVHYEQRPPVPIQVGQQTKVISIRAGAI